MQKFNQLFLAFLTIATFITCTSTAKQRPEGGWLWKISGNGLRIPLICSEHIMVHTTYYINIPTVFPNSTKPLTLVANSPEKAKQRPNQPLLRSEPL
jgi:hypothetical protein